MIKTFTLHVFLLATLLFGTTTVTDAQNLVPNPGFEVQDSCPAVSELFVAQPWDSPTIGTPDAFNNTCPTQNGPGHTGIGSSGVFIYSSFPDNREYMQAPLTGTLTAGQSYCVSFWVKRSDFRFACDRMGAHFRTGAYSETTTGVLPFTPQVENAAGNVLTGTSWHQITGVFTAAGGENHIMLGNFRTDAQTMNPTVNVGSTSEVCYYKFDDIVVQSCVVGIEEATNVGYSIFPIPAQNVVNITVPTREEVQGIRLVDVAGRTVIDRQSADQRNGTIMVDVSGLARGVWTLHLETTSGPRVERIVLAD